MSQKSKGGARPGAGRPPLPLGEDTIRRRIPRRDYQKLEYYRQLEKLVFAWSERAYDSTGPRWSRLNDFLSEVQQLEQYKK